MTSLVILYLPFMLSEYVHRISGLQSPGATSFSRILISVSHAINLIIYTEMSKKFKKAAWEEVQLCVRRANLQSLHKRPKRQRTDTKRETFSSILASNVEWTPDDLEESEAGSNDSDKVIRNNFNTNDTNDSKERACRSKM
jgi:hypothetical protein